MTIKAKIDVSTIMDTAKEELSKILKEPTKIILTNDTLKITLPINVIIKNYFTEAIEITFVDERRATP